jgi:hypothetical protein
MFTTLIDDHDESYVDRYALRDQTAALSAGDADARRHAALVTPERVCIAGGLPTMARCAAMTGDGMGVHVERRL